MPRICGLFIYGGLPSTLEVIRSQIEILQSRVKEPVNFYFDINIGLCQQEVPGKNSRNRLPSVEGLTIVADVCLTNRTELFEEFGVLLSDRDGFCDHDLILKSYRKWGEDCVNHLVGDFAFAIWNQRTQNLFCARDHLGGSNLFYFNDGSRFVFGSTPSLVAGFRDVEKSLNKKKLASLLFPEPHSLTEGESWYSKIYPLRPATVLSIDTEGLKTREYWTPKLQDPLTLKKDDEILEAFRELMFQIMEARLRNQNPVTGLLSGGLDSSSIVSVAAKILQKQNRSITVFSSVLADRNDAVYDDERSFIEQFRAYPNVDIKFVSAPGKGPFSDLKDLFETQDSPLVFSQHYLYSAFLKEADCLGSRTLLEGGFGECGPTNYGTGAFAEMLSKLKLKTLWRELRLRQKLYGDSIGYNFRANALNPNLPEFLVNLRHGRPKVSPNEYHVLNDVFAKDLLRDLDVPRNQNTRIAPDHRINQLNEIIYIRLKMSELTAKTFGKTSVERSYPFLDKRLLEFCLAVPLNLKVRDGYSRYLARAGLDQILPPKIQWRTTKTPFSPDYLRRYFQQIGNVSSLLSEIRPNDPINDVLDIKKIQNLIEFTISNTKIDSEFDEVAFYHVPFSIYLIYFLRKFPEFRL